MAKKGPPIKDERRRFPRLRAAVLYRTPKKEGSTVPTYDLGLGGVRIYSNVYFKKGKQIEIELCFPKGNSIVATVRAVWINVLPPGSDATFDVGLEFIDLSANAIDELKKVLEMHSSDE